MIITVQPQKTKTSYQNSKINYPVKQIELAENAMSVTCQSDTDAKRLFTKLQQTHDVGNLENKPIPSLKVNRNGNTVNFSGETEGFSFIITSLVRQKFISEKAAEECTKEVTQLKTSVALKTSL